MNLKINPTTFSQCKMKIKKTLIKELIQSSLFKMKMKLERI